MSNTKTVMGQAANTQGIPLDITDVFSTYLYTGNGSTQTITNDIDLAGEGGLVVIKRRDGAANNWGWYDTERGPDSHLKSNGTNAENTQPDVEVKDFNSNGFDLGIDWNAYINTSGGSFASWTFRKAPKFFDVVTYTGDGVAGREIAHNLGSIPGCFILKATSTTGDWIVYHRGLSDPSNKALALHLTNGEFDNTYFNDTDPTATHFVVGGQGLGINNTGVTYVAYLFAHNNGDGDFGPSGDADIIKCGSYTGNGSGTAGPEINLGFEPQWILAKRTDSTGYWTLVDSMRGMIAGGDDKILYPNTSDAEQQSTRFVPSATGFQVNSTNGYVNASGGTYIYMAIRRGPLAQPKSGTEVFAVKRHAGADGPQPAGITSDMLITTNSQVANTERFNFNRLTNGKVLYTSQTFAEGNYSAYLNFGTNNGVNTTGLWGNTSVPLYYHFKRAPGFFDVVAYTGDGASTRDIAHNLGVAPELIFLKSRNLSNVQWPSWHSGTPNQSRYLNLTSGGFSTAGGLPVYVGQAVSNTTFRVSTDGSANQSNGSGNTYIAYLFASLDGISKVGSYTGNGSSQTIDCGFTSGARFILIKRTDSTGDWYVWDTERGIVAANDPHLSLNTTAAEVTSDDSIDPDNSGFIVNQVGATNINASSATYIFYAIA